MLKVAFLISVAFSLANGCKSIENKGPNGDGGGVKSTSFSNRTAIVKCSKILNDPSADADLRALAKSTEGNGSETMIDYRSSKPVVVYRAIGNIASLDKLDLNANYAKNLNNFGEDFVTHHLDWAAHYGTYGRKPNQGVLIKYELPANLLDSDKSMQKQEPYYVISSKKLAAIGVTNVSKFVVAIARMNSNQDESGIRKEDDERLVWVSANELMKIKRRSGFNP